MKPNFALSLSYDAVELLQRAAGGWLSVGSVRFDRPDLDTAIEALIARARASSADGITTKLIVPGSEVRFATVLAPGPTDEARRYQIEAGIEGLTPYALPDLAYDWSIEGDHAQVAIVARETLREAEEFAVERGFNPVSFVAVSSSGEFLGEPFFGQTAFAGSLLGAGAMVQPDSEPVRSIGKVPEPGAAAPTEPPGFAAAKSSVTAKPEGDVPAAQFRSAPRTPAATKPPAKPPAVPPAVAAALKASERKAAAKVPPQPQGLQGGTNLLGGLVRRMGTAIRREQAAAPPAPPAPSPLSATSGSAALGAASGAVSSVKGPSAAIPRSLQAEGTRSGGASAAVSAAALPVPDDLDEPARPEGAVLAFSSRRTAQPAGQSQPSGAPQAGSGDRNRAANPGGRLAILPRGAGGSGAATRLTRSGREMARQTLDRLGLLTSVRRALGRGPTGAKIPVPPPQPKPGPRAIPTSVTAPAGVSSAKAQSAASLARVAPAATAAGSVQARSGSPDGAPLTEAEALTVFGRRGMTQPEPLLPPRALMAIGGVLLVLVAVAVWALYFNRPAATPADLAQGAGVVSEPVTGSGDTGSITPPAEATAALPPAAAPATDPVQAEPTQTGTATDPDAPDTAVAPVPPEADTQTALVPDTPAAPGLAESPTESPTELPAESPVETATVDGATTTDPDTMLEALVREALSGAQQAETLDALGATPPGDATPTPDTLTEAPSQPTAAPQAAPSGTADAGQTPAESAAAEATPADTSPAAPNTRLAMPGRLTVPPVDELRPVSLSPPPALEDVLAGAAAPPPAEVPPAEVPTAAPQPGAPVAGPVAGPVSEADVEVTVTNGRPAVVPTVRPARIGPPPPVIQPQAAIPEAAPTVEAEAAPVTAEAPPEPQPAPEALPEASPEAPAEAAPPPVVADDTPRADPALAGARPEPRSPRVRALGEAQRAVQPEPPATEDEARAAPDEQPARLDQGGRLPDVTPALAAPGLATPQATLAALGSVVPPAPRPPTVTTSLTPEIPATTDATAAPPPGGVDLVLLRPQRRPTDLVPDPSATGPDAAGDVASDTAAPEDVPPEVVARSLVPSARPSQLTARVQAALEAERRRPAATAAARATAPAAAAAPAPQASAAAAAPSIPSSASVQQSATERRVIRTREANLIGVFGAPSSRRALVRMSNGQVVRLQVGDRFDGGQVSAIGDSELRYVRGGRDRVLRIASRG